METSISRWLTKATATPLSTAGGCHQSGPPEDLGEELDRLLGITPLKVHADGGGGGNEPGFPCYNCDYSYHIYQHWCKEEPTADCTGLWPFYNEYEWTRRKNYFSCPLSNDLYVYCEGWNYHSCCGGASSPPTCSSTGDYPCPTF